jgi:hypothetical protein
MKIVFTCFFALAVIDELSIASISMPCEGVYCSNATFWPDRSSIFWIDASREITASPPWVLSTITTALASWPELRRLGCSWAQKSEVRQAHCAVLDSNSVVSVGMSSLMTNSTFSPSLA